MLCNLANGHVVACPTAGTIFITLSKWSQPTKSTTTLSESTLNGLKPWFIIGNIWTLFYKWVNFRNTLIYDEFLTPFKLQSSTSLWTWPARTSEMWHPPCTQIRTLPCTREHRTTMVNCWPRSSSPTRYLFPINQKTVVKMHKGWFGIFFGRKWNII